MIAMFMKRESMERQSFRSNKLLSASNIDVFKNSHRLAEVNMNKGLKKKTLLEEIQKYGGPNGQAGRPIIVVPASEYPGNICLKNCI